MTATSEPGRDGLPSKTAPAAAAPSDSELAPYFAGQAIYGDDFDADQIAAWFADEVQGYAGLLAANGSDEYRYGYHALNALHGFDHLPQDWRSEHALAFGSAYGQELQPYLGRLGRITLLDATTDFHVADVQGKPVDYLLAQASGEITAADASFDLLTCLGVLHHIPNVSFVLRELYRVTTGGGHALLREPITSMGDWRLPRSGLTRRERGLPRQALAAAIAAAGWQVVRLRSCQFSPLTKLMHLARVGVFDRRWLTRIDALLAQTFGWNWRYHRGRWPSRFAPGSVFYVLRKP